MKLSIYKQGGPEAETAPYVMTISLVGEVVPPHDSFHLPIYKDVGEGGKDVFAVEICGFRLDAADPDALMAPTAKLMGGLVNIGRLPTYVFMASDSLLVYPVYTDGDEVFATTPGGPVFRHVELANVRQYLSDYLHTMELCGWAGHVETLHARGINRTNLGLVRPAFYLKKRVPGETEFWAPVFQSDDGRSIYAYAVSAKREVPVDGGREVLALQNMVAEALLDDRRLHDVFDLRPDRIFPESAEAMLNNFQQQPYQITYRTARQSEKSADLEIPLYRNGKKYVAVEHRPNEDRYNVFIGRDPLDLRDRMAQDLVRRGRLLSDADVELMTV